MKTLKRDILETFNVQIDCLKDSQSDSYNKNDMEDNVNDLIRDRALSMQEGEGAEGFCGEHEIFQAYIDGLLNIFQNF